ncbi:hypothetical protein AVBRAN12640_07940 [Campylobacter sp. RM12640]|uniref:hypothetical protein n=1 Tax=unclassified Campylobacter TaxID=2593542 RepID=UPI001D855049|nr:hypothetical protein [Campylobacter sp. RM12642]MBZ7982465.1 hypothetical protein [Campylobacter sp. RM12640]MBZ7990062.1 hypothetical protein [Campylobacter sp. RM12635]MBZ8008217.1 hypothetical protein [Campylobacter sp. RM9334]
MKRGEAKIEFYSNIEYIKDKYNSGIVVSKILFEHFKKEKNIQMCYEQFNKYFNDEFKLKNQLNYTKNENISKDIKEPKKIEIRNDNKVFSPLYGKDIKKIL